MNQFDLLVIGGGINGAAIARDAAGRGLKVLLVERDDLASHTSSASSKLIHGGLRYLEQYEFRLVRESLHERAVLLKTAPHLVRPLRFILPDPKGGRPWWLIRLGLWLYGMLAGRGNLPRPRAVSAKDESVRRPLKGRYRLAEYYDAWVDDSRLVVVNAVDAAERGAEIATRTALVSARAEHGRWKAELSDGRSIDASMIVNAAGPWVAEVLSQRLGGGGEAGVRLVRGTHVAVPHLFLGPQAYILQAADGRVVFALPFSRSLTLLGTTDAPASSPDDAGPSTAEIDYLCATANAYFVKQTNPADVRWAFGGIRALYDDGAVSAKDVTRDYRLELEERDGAKLLSVFGGKITTARALAEEVMAELEVSGARWTHDAPLPGGAFSQDHDDRSRMGTHFPRSLLHRWDRAYGSRSDILLREAMTVAQLGRRFGADLYEAEVRYLVEHEFARAAEDVLWRRTKLGLVLSADEVAALEEFMSTIIPRLA